VRCIIAGKGSVSAVRSVIYANGSIWRGQAMARMLLQEVKLIVGIIVGVIMQVIVDVIIMRELLFRLHRVFVRLRWVFTSRLRRRLACFLLASTCGGFSEKIVFQELYFNLISISVNNYTGMLVHPSTRI
jgi:hypothetical protein